MLLIHKVQLLGPHRMYGSKLHHGILPKNHFQAKLEKILENRKLENKTARRGSSACALCGNHAK